ncbi:hypothetical protein J21TS7_41420 [Paenibacillus cineris]|uniref:Uncharacterized protein n=1 Tax=Paenibacillus cineris TaxID=237530 RepID=A0ABQ4LH06_9BACL|nr:hypothetical protein J21TS7_41420 [Paenibacillus cineris]GIO58470.1 hypothetical protein J43TS9_00440 [Paenibacillus cineris]
MQFDHTIRGGLRVSEAPQYRGADRLPLYRFIKIYGYIIRKEAKTA